MAVRCCGSECDLPWAIDIQAGDDDHDKLLSGVPRRVDAGVAAARTSGGGESDTLASELLALAPAFFRVSRVPKPDRSGCVSAGGWSPSISNAYQYRTLLP